MSSQLDLKLHLALSQELTEDNKVLYHVSEDISGGRA